ncbi:MAG TPA: IreB family regulatory phosphoprotein, partial [Bacilli bacterium]|nr:IreB family regulatory phosphoprotein [Bacilli bacterium]
MDNTTLFNIDDIQDALVETTLDEVYTSLLKKGYNPVNQIVGYLISGDSSYITNYEN